MIIESLQPKTDIPDISVYQFLFKENHRIIDRNKPCFIDAEDPSQIISFATLENLILRFAAGLKSNFPNFAIGDVIAMYSPNEFYYPAIIHGCTVAGGSFASIDHSCDAETAADCLHTVGAKIIIAHPETLDRAKKAAEFIGLPVKNIFILGENDIDGIRSVHNAIWNHNDLAVPTHLTKEELSTIPSYFYYTSGTTGKKKAVAITQSNMISWLSAMPVWYSNETKFLTHTEPHHGSTLILAMHLQIMHGYTTYILKKFTFEKYFLAIQRNKINIVSLQPWMAAIISKEDSIVNQYDISSLNYAHCSGAPVSKNLCTLFRERFGIRIINIYGMTEVMLPFINDNEKSMQGSVGLLSSNFCCKLINDNGKEVGYDEIGELCIKEPTKKLGYYNNPKANDKSFDQDGFFHTGDLFRVNENGYFTHIDRINDVIKYRYQKISPQEIEIVLMTHPLVIDSAVVGWFSEEEGSYLVRAFVVLKKHHQDVEEIKKEIIEITKSELSDLKQIRGGLFVLNELPRNNTGKINRNALRHYNV